MEVIAMQDSRTGRLSAEMLHFHQLYSEKISKRFRNQHVDAVTQAEYLVLAIVAESGAVSMSSLCERTMMLKQQITRMVNQLEEKGLVQRERSAQNRRVVLVRPTQAGCSLIQEVHKAVHDELSRIFSQLDEQAVEAYLGAIETINDILERFPSGKG